MESSPAKALYARAAKAGFTHPAAAIGAGIVETSAGLNQHIETHEQPERVVPPLVVDERFNDDQGSAGRQGFIGFAEQHAFVVQAPIVKDAAHDEHVRSRQRIAEKISGAKLHAVFESERCDVFFKDRLHHRQIEAVSR